MSAATETRVENMLANIRDTNGSSASTSRSSGGEGSGQGSQLSSAARENPQPRLPTSGVDKEKQNVQLRENQHQLKVDFSYNDGLQHELISHAHICVGIACTP
jgi:hypothetical protein